MPLLKSRSKKAMSKNIATEMDAGKPQKQSIAIAYSVMKRAKKKKMAEGGLVHPDDEKNDSEDSITKHSPTYDNREQSGPEGFDASQRKVSPKGRNAPDNTEEDDESLQE